MEYVSEHVSDQLMVNGVVWGPVVWDSNRGIPKNPNPAHFSGIPNIHTANRNHQFTIR